MLLVVYGLHSKDEKQKNFWHCTCGTVNKKDDAFCSVCGAPKPAATPVPPPDGTWHCTCGAFNQGDFCVQCGKPRA